jgi:GntR family transcriptional regulator
VKKEKPSYLYVKDELVKKIENGDFEVGSKLPSEIKMAKYFNVSRETFRSAVKKLEQEGKVVVKRGVGTFVSSPLSTIPSSLENLWSIGSLIRSAGLKEGEHRESITTVPCKKEWSEKLSCEPQSEVIKHERIRTADGEPVVYSINFLPKKVLGAFFNNENFSGSLLNYLKSNCGISIVRADTELSVPLHTDKYCQKLLIHPSTTVVLLKQLHYDEINRPILYSYDYLRNDVFKFWIRRTLTN